MAEGTEKAGHAEESLTPSSGKKQYVKFAFYKVDPTWRQLPIQEREAGKKEFIAVLEEFSSDMLIMSYSLVGIRGDVDFLLWQVTERLEAFQELATQLYSTGLGQYTQTPYSYLSMTKRSIYITRHRPEKEEGTRLTIQPKGARYVFVYPFVKTRSWYRLTKAARQGMMDEHIAVGHRYPSVKIHTSYSFGLDDQEFVLAFETNKPDDFLDLVMDLRETEASSYTLRDTPIFTCLSMGFREMLESLGG